MAPETELGENPIFNCKQRSPLQGLAAADVELDAEVPLGTSCKALSMIPLGKIAPVSQLIFPQPLGAKTSPSAVK